MSRAAALEKDTKDAYLQIKYKAAQARVWDFKRKFVEAASKYYELSLNTLITELEKMQALNNALNCTILAPAGKYSLLTYLWSFWNKSKIINN